MPTPSPANDSFEVFDRLKGIAERGMNAPETLKIWEIRQLSFALSIYMLPTSRLPAPTET